MRTVILGVSLLALVACEGQQQAPAAPVEEVVTPRQDIVRNATKNAYFGDLHVHTRNSFDAFIFGTRATPDDAYRFAKGETIDNGAGHDITLSGPPLDFYSVTDHGEYMGIVPAMAKRGSRLSKTETAKSIFGLLATDRRGSFLKIGTSVVAGEPIADIYDLDHMNGVWAETVAATQRHNEPGVFTTFSGYEFTTMTQVTDLAAANLHRNVIFKDEAPKQLFTTLNSPNPENLWSWMNSEREQGRDVLAIPHNSNASNGQMFASTMYEGGDMDADYIANRIYNEPLVEITQVKGTSETHPMLSPNDEWADFEQYEYLIGSTNKSDVKAGSFVRDALARGLSMDTNPYEFGFIGSSDTHLGAPSLSEEEHFGKFPHDMAAENRQSTPAGESKDWSNAGNMLTDLISTPQYGASGLAGVWAEANTREDLFAAMRAKETFGTSGPRIKVRMFAGDYDADILGRADMVEAAYAGGVPMGGTVTASQSPNFLAWAIKDPDGMALQRLQIIKVWNEGGQKQEAIYDVACAGDGVPDSQTNRCPDNGASVDISNCVTTADSGAAELKALWSDPNYASADKASYYVRVLENPKCRWSTWDAVRNGTPPNPNMKETVQDRAWGSPIWTARAQ